MSATLTVDPHRIVLPDSMAAAVGQLSARGEDRLSPEESALLETMAILIQADDDRHYQLLSAG